MKKKIFKDSPFLPLFDHYLRLLLERGTINQIIQRYVTTEKPQCSDTSGEPIGFDNCFTAFLVLLLGLAVGLAALTVELADGGGRLCLGRLHDGEEGGEVKAATAWHWRLLRLKEERVIALEKEVDYLRTELAAVRKRR